MSPTQTDRPDTLVQLDPGVILMEDNARFSTEVSVDEAQTMRASILEVGRIMQPVGVVPLDTPDENGHTHRLRYGFRRVAGARLANEHGAGVMVPAIILHDADTQGVLKEQVAENVARKSLSLMDTAVAADKMLKAGMGREQVREVFTRPVGTKGGGVQPASNAWLNMVLGLLELPKSIQARIHNGDLGIAAAYRLMKAPPDKRLAILEAAEAVQANIRAAEEKEEAGYEALEKKITEAVTKGDEAAKSIDELKAAVEISEKHVEGKKAEAAALYTKKQQAESAVRKAKTDEAKAKAKDLLKKVTESHKAAEVEVRTAEGRLKADQGTLTKAEQSQKKYSDTASELRKKLEEKRAAASKPKKAAKKDDGKISPKAVDAAAKSQGVETGKKRLTGPEMRKVIEDLSAVATYPKVAAVGHSILKCFNSDTTSGQMVKELATLLGEKAATKK